ncbi:hypothetical protein [Symbiobacterium terraclitae]|uniref:hypothetical protein n=1 Tax=Symbiobacterium terraclitae TaxID=557451 RepID=UPI0035B56188
MESKHTPGPWEVRRPAHITWNGPTGAFEIYADDKLICQRPWAEGNPQAIREYEADARLIAAAPDLLEALEAQEAADRHWHDCAGCKDPREWCTEGLNLLARARELRADALAKATGKNLNAPA